MENGNKLTAKINKLVFSGGGMRGYSYLGVLKYLEENHIIEQIKTIAGTSIGSLMATLICLGFNSTELTHIFTLFDYKRHQIIDLSCLFEKFGLDSFDKIHDYISVLFKSKKYSPEITLEEFYKKTNVHLIFTATCVNTHCATYLDYLNTPNMPVIRALQASMALPFIFASVNYRGLTYIDGGLLDNFPVNLFENDPQSVLAINLYCPIKSSSSRIQSIEQYCLHVFICLYNGYHDMVQKFNKDFHIINLVTQKYDTLTLNFDLKDEDKQSLYNFGYQKTKEYFDSILIEKIKDKENINDKEKIDDNTLMKDLLELLDQKKYDEIREKINQNLTQSKSESESEN